MKFQMIVPYETTFRRLSKKNNESRTKYTVGTFEIKNLKSESTEKSLNSEIFFLDANSNPTIGTISIYKIKEKLFSEDMSFKNYILKNTKSSFEIPLKNHITIDQVEEITSGMQELIQQIDLDTASNVYTSEQIKNFMLISKYNVLACKLDDILFKGSYDEPKKTIQASDFSNAFGSGILFNSTTQNIENEQIKKTIDKISSRFRDVVFIDGILHKPCAVPTYLVIDKSNNEKMAILNMTNNTKPFRSFSLTERAKMKHIYELDEKDIVSTEQFTEIPSISSQDDTTKTQIFNLAKTCLEEASGAIQFRDPHYFQKFYNLKNALKPYTEYTKQYNHEQPIADFTSLPNVVTALKTLLDENSKYSETSYFSSSALDAINYYERSTFNDTNTELRFP